MRLLVGSRVQHKRAARIQVKPASKVRLSAPRRRGRLLTMTVRSNVAGSLTVTASPLMRGRQVKLARRTVRKGAKPVRWQLPKRLAGRTVVLRFEVGAKGRAAATATRVSRR